MLLDIIKIGDINDSKLKQKSLPVIKEMSNLQELIDNMFETLQKTGGVGLSAPQVGENFNLFIIKLPSFEQVFINPKIILKGFDIETTEGCLSLPGMECKVKRKQRVKIEFHDRNFKKIKFNYSDIRAIIIQHEYDHLIGKLISTDL
jgi:peptide deformylase